MTGREGSADTLIVVLYISVLLTDMLKWEKWLLMQIIADLLNMLPGTNRQPNAWTFVFITPCTKEAI